MAVSTVGGGSGQKITPKAVSMKAAYLKAESNLQASWKAMFKDVPKYNYDKVVYYAGTTLDYMSSYQHSIDTYNDKAWMNKQTPQVRDRVQREAHIAKIELQELCKLVYSMDKALTLLGYKRPAEWEQQMAKKNGTIYHEENIGALVQSLHSPDMLVKFQKSHGLLDPASNAVNTKYGQITIDKLIAGLKYKAKISK